MKMGICEVCDIETKVAYCCSSNPKTGETKSLVIGGIELLACNNIDEDGFCEIYPIRPAECKSYECPEKRCTDLTTLRTIRPYSLDNLRI